MVVQSASVARDTRGGAQALAALVVGVTSSVHPHARALLALDNASATRNASDALHHLSMLHGRHPGVIDHAAARTTDAELRQSLFAIADSFVEERDFLGRLVVAAGPVPSTPGQSETEASVIHQRHAIEMLAQSDRHGCALGAALAVSLDWHAIRFVLQASARRFGIEVAQTTLIDEAQLLALATAACASPAIERAMLFGAQQISMQHNGLWDLLEARAAARGEY